MFFGLAESSLWKLVCLPRLVQLKCSLWETWWRRLDEMGIIVLRNAKLPEKIVNSPSIFKGGLVLNEKWEHQLFDRFETGSIWFYGWAGVRSNICSSFFWVLICCQCSQNLLISNSICISLITWPITSYIFKKYF